MTHERLRTGSEWGQYAADLIRLAAGQPTVDSRLVSGRAEHTQYRGQYYRRFPEIKRVREGIAEDHEVFYVRMVKERFGYDLVQFYESHETLCEDICERVEALAPYDVLVDGYNRLVAAESAGVVASGSAESLQACVNHELGIEAIGMYYWDRLNPLLEQAYVIMDGQTLNAPFLAR